MSRFNPVAFYRELRRRRVFRVAVLYGVGAWGVIAAADVIFPQLVGWVGDPDRAMRALFIAAIVLAPVALVFGWLYDVTTEGVKRTVSFSATAHDPDISLHPADRWIIGALGGLSLAVVVATAVHIVRMEPTVPAAGPVIPANSIAVLPFEICADAAVDPLLAAGITNEVLRHLAEIPNLKVTGKSLIVVGRASAFAFAEADVTPQRIASTLRVHYLLTGTVCREGDALVVQAELVDENGYLAWSHGYTEQLNAAGQVTRSVASLLAEGVAGHLGAVMPVPAEGQVDRLAYEQLLIGREYRDRGEAEQARAAFEAALDRKPDYADALYELAMMELPDQDSTQTSAELETAIRLAKPALAMARREAERNPDSANAHFVAGRIQFALVSFSRDLAWRKSEPLDVEGWDAQLAEAEAHLRRSLELNPTNSLTSLFLWYTLIDEGRGSEAMSVLERALERDPFNGYLSSRAARGWQERGQHRKAMDLLERFKQLPDPPGNAFFSMMEVALIRGRLDEACEILIDALQNYPDSVRDSFLPWIAWRFGAEFIKEVGLKEESAAWIARLDAPGIPDWARDFASLTDDDYYARASQMTDQEILDLWSEMGLLMLHALALHGEYERPIRLLEKMRHSRWWYAELQRLFDERPMILLAAVYLEVGRDDDAARLLDEAQRALEKGVQSGYRGLLTLDHLATTYALQGRFPAAFATLELSLSVGNTYASLDCSSSSFADPLTFVHDPYASVHSDPRLLKLVRQCQTETHRQAERVRALLAEHDLDELLAPLIAYYRTEKR